MFRCPPREPYTLEDVNYLLALASREEPMQIKIAYWWGRHVEEQGGLESVIRGAQKTRPGVCFGG